ncbi:MAG: complex I NDUFA9 subunit family protein [Rhodomicrobium sp.]
MADRIMTVFGGTGFLGRRIVRHLRDQGFAVRIASRHAQQAGEGTGGELMRADINNEASVMAAVAGAYAVVNAVSLYRERRSETFNAVHVKAAERLARQAHQAGVERLVHVSGIGADAQSKSSYICSRGEGELAVQAAFADAVIVRPAVLFGPDDAFLTTLVRLLKRLPVCPLFGQGMTRLQPVHVEDVAEAISRALQPDASQPATYELGGPTVYAYKDLLKLVAGRLHKRPILFSMPFSLWRALAAITEMLPEAPLTRNQVELMEMDTVVSAGMSGFSELDITPESLEHTLEEIIAQG